VAHVELFFDLVTGVLGIGGVDEHERRHLHEREQGHEENDDPRLQALYAHRSSTPATGQGSKRRLSMDCARTPLKRFTSWEKAAPFGPPGARM
jgi:hypothetical protein